MSATTFDTLTYSKKPREAGVPERQAEAHAEALRELLEDNLATKRDLKELETVLRHEIALIRRDVLVKLGAIVVAGIAVVTGILGVVIAMLALQG